MALFWQTQLNARPFDVPSERRLHIGTETDERSLTAGCSHVPATLAFDINRPDQ
jgi:hypothetical protein